MMLVLPGKPSTLVLTGQPADVAFDHPAEIGTFQNRLAPNTERLLHQLITDARKEETNDSESLEPGTQLLSFNLGEENIPLEKTIAFPLDQPLPPGVRKFDEEMQEVAQSLLSHRQRTLKGVAAWGNPAVVTSNTLSVRWELKNSGVVPIQLRNPAAAQGTGPIAVSLIVEKDLPPDQMQDADRVLIELQSGDVFELAPDAKRNTNPNPVLDLLPGKETAFLLTVRQHLYLAPGRYRGTVIYTSQTDDLPQSTAVGGRLQIPIGNLVVKEASQ